MWASIFQYSLVWPVKSCAALGYNRLKLRRYRICTKLYSEPGRRSRKLSCLLCTVQQGMTKGSGHSLLVMVNNGIPASVFPASLKRRSVRGNIMFAQCPYITKTFKFFVYPSKLKVGRLKCKTVFVWQIISYPLSPCSIVFLKSP